MSSSVVSGGGKVESRDQAAMLSGPAGDVIPGRPLTSENSFELQIQAQRKHLPISYLTCNGQHAFCLIRGARTPKIIGCRMLYVAVVGPLTFPEDCWGSYLNKDSLILSTSSMQSETSNSSSPC